MELGPSPTVYLPQKSGNHTVGVAMFQARFSLGPADGEQLFATHLRISSPLAQR